MGEPTSTTVAARLSTSRKELLDLTFRNPLLHYKPLQNRLDLDGASRKLVLIAPEEIALAVERVLEDAFGMSVEELPKSVSRLLGFERLTQEMKDHLDGQVAALAARGRLSISNGEVTLPR